MSANDDVLFGVITVQLGLASSREVMAVTRDLPPADGGKLGEALVAKGAIDEADRRLVEAVGKQALEAQGGDLQRALGRFGGEASLLNTFGGTVLYDDSGGVVVGEPPEELREEPFTVTTEHPGRYTLGGGGGGRAPEDVADTAELGRGGIGRVLLAQDEHLGREVAVKELLPDRAPSPQKKNSVVARFLREARVTGQLEHPNIVPVYELGQRRDGTLYYTMKVVRGRTLTEALREKKSLAERLELLTHFADLCDAMAYAHSRGVIHRDIKPDNVMVGEFGETVVLDWGLAKARDKRDLRSQDLHRGLRLAEDSDLDETRAGAVMGTPMYMPPEQAEGEPDKIDERSDVYGLGAVLYELLSGRSPHRGDSVMGMLIKVVAGELRPLGQVAPEAPPELAAIATKALTRDPAGRYANAGEMARDVRAFLTGGRVRAHQYGSWELLKRFAARHKVTLLVAAVAFLLLVGLGVFSYIEVIGERNRALAAEEEAVAARAQAEQALAEAERARDGAEELVQFMLTDLRDRLEPVGRLDVLEGVVASVQGYYQRDEASGVTPSLARQRNKARAFERVGDVRQAQGKLDEAQRMFRRSLELRQAVLEQHPNLPEAHAEIGQSLRKIGILLNRRGQLAEASSELERSKAELETAIAQRPDELEWQLWLARALFVLGDIRSKQADSKGALASCERACDLHRALVERQPSEQKWRYELAGALTTLGHMRFDTGAFEPAQADFAAAEELLLKLTAEQPQNMLWQRELAAAHDAVGDARAKRGDLAAARQSYEASLAIMRRLAERDPANAGWQRDLAVSYNRVGDVLFDLTQLEPAQPMYEASLAIFERLSLTDPREATWKRDAAVAHTRLGDIGTKLKRYDAALESLRAAQRLTDELLAKQPTNQRLRHDRALQLQRIGVVQAGAGKLDEARASLQQAVELLKELIGADPDDVSLEADLGEAQTRLGELAQGIDSLPPRARVLKTARPKRSKVVKRPKMKKKKRKAGALRF